MPDALPVDREAVEAFIRDKGVTKVPRGASGIFDEQGNYIKNPLKTSRPSGRPRKAPPPAPRPDPAPEPHVPARRANVERFAAAVEAKPEPPKAPEKPSAAHTGAVRSQGPKAPSKAETATGRARLKHDDEIRQMVEKEWSVPMIAEALGMARSGVRKACDRLGLEPRKERARDSDRKRQVGELIEAGKTAVEIAEAVSLTPARVYQIATSMGVKVPSRTEAAKDRIRELVAAGKHVGEIAEALDRSEHSVRVTLGKLGLKAAPKPRTRKAAAQTKPKKANPKRPGRNGAADVKKAERAQRHAGIVADRRRFRSVAVPMGEPAVALAPDHEAVKEGRTYFPTRVFDPSAEDRVLIDGCNNSKIGGDVLVGWLKGARIYTLTLEERATCPRSCEHWRTCYGSSMQWARRWRHGPALERRIAAEVRQLCKAHDRILIRLHVLGDFYSLEYVDFWRGLLAEHGGLHVFGFTAWGEDTEIGGAVALLRGTFPKRWWVRHSGRTGPWGSFTIDFPTSKKRIGDALVCPEQRDGMSGGKEGRHCGNCAACWSSDVPITFVEH